MKRRRRREGWRRAWRFFGRRGVEDDVEREIESHIAQRAEAFEAEGWAPERARREAERLFGDRNQVARVCRKIVGSHHRAVRRGMMMDAFRQDLRFGARVLVRSPGFALMAVTTLALGTGANTAVFSVIRGVLLRPLPYEQPDRLVTLAERSTRGTPMAVAWANLADWRTETSSFSGLAVATPDNAVVLGGEAPVQARIAWIGQDFWKVFPVRPVRGRLTTSADHRKNGAPVAVVSRSFWQNQLGGRALDGYDLDLRGFHVAVVGVVPDGLNYPVETQIWLPVQMLSEFLNDSRSAHSFRVVGRLAPGVSIAQAHEEVDALTRRVVAGHPDENPDFLATGAFVTPLLEHLVGSTRRPLYLLLAAAGLVLLVACTNVASTLLARGAGRSRELALRAALGAGRGRIARQLLVESLLLAAVGAVAGVGMAILVVRGVVAGGPTFLPRLYDVRVDGTVLVFTAGVAALTAVLFGLLPARRLAGGGTGDALRQGSRGNAMEGRAGVWHVLVGTEVALALMLLVGSGLLVRSFRSLLAESPGFDPANVDVMPVSLSQVKYATGADDARWYTAFIRRVRAIPGVAEAGVMSTVPVEGASNAVVALDGDESTQAVGQYVATSGGALRALHVPLVAGRLFDERDGPGNAHVALVSESFADRYWPGENPLGKSVTGGSMDSFGGQHRFARVVGVVGDVRYGGLDVAAAPTIYFPWAQRPSRVQSNAYVVVSATSDGASLFGPLRAALHEADPDVPVHVAMLADNLSGSLGERRFVMLLLGGFSLTALILAGVGIFGVVSYSVTRRTREMGIRLALGAAPGEVRRLVVGGAMRMVLVGLVAGLIGAVALTRVMRSLLYGVSPTDPVTLTAAAALLLGAGLMASWFPAHRGTRVDPMRTMRTE